MLKLFLKYYFIIIYEISVEFDRCLNFQGFDGIFGVIVVIFDDVKSGENGVFSGFYRSRYRSDFGIFFEIIMR